MTDRYYCHLSVCPSVYDDVYCAQTGEWVKSCTVVFITGHFLFTSSDTFTCRMYRLATKQ